MRTRIRRAYPFAAIILAVIVQGALPLSGVFAGKKSHTLSSATEDGLAADGQSSEAARLNSIGVAYMNQQRFADAQKQFESALKSQPDYLLAKLNLGISLLSQQKSEDARKALQEAAEKLPRDPYAWYNLGLVYKDISEQEKAIEAFQHVTEIAPTEPDAFYFIGYLKQRCKKLYRLSHRPSKYSEYCSSCHSLACGLEYSFTEVGYPFRRQSGRTIPGILMPKCYFRNL